MIRKTQINTGDILKCIPPPPPEPGKDGVFC